MVDGQQVLHLWGSRRELGYAEGALFCWQIARLMEANLFDTIVAQRGTPYEEITASVVDTVILSAGDEAQLRGLYDGMRDHCTTEQLTLESDYLELEAGGRRPIRYEDLLVANTVGDWGCSSFSAWGEASATGQLIHGRALDYYVDAENLGGGLQMVKVYRSDDDGGVRWLAVNIPGLLGCTTCIGEDRTGIMMHDVFGTVATSSRAVPRFFATRDALLAAIGSTDPIRDAEAALESAPQFRGNNLHLFVPGTNDATAVVFEYDGNANDASGLATVRFPGAPQGGLTTGDAITCTNHYRIRAAPETCDRYDTLVAGLDLAAANGGLDAASAFDLLDAVAQSGIPVAVHAVLFDAAADTLRVCRPSSAYRSATEGACAELSLSSLFDGFPD